MPLHAHGRYDAHNVYEVHRESGAHDQGAYWTGETKEEYTAFLQEQEEIQRRADPGGGEELAPPTTKVGADVFAATAVAEKAAYQAAERRSTLASEQIEMSLDAAKAALKVGWEFPKEARESALELGETNPVISKFFNKAGKARYTWDFGDVTPTPGRQSLENPRSVYGYTFYDLVETAADGKKKIVGTHKEPTPGKTYPTGEDAQRIIDEQQQGDKYEPGFNPSDGSYSIVPKQETLADKYPGSFESTDEANRFKLNNPEYADYESHRDHVSGRVFLQKGKPGEKPFQIGDPIEVGTGANRRVYQEYAAGKFQDVTPEVPFELGGITRRGGRDYLETAEGQFRDVTQEPTYDPGVVEDAGRQFLQQLSGELDPLQREFDPGIISQQGMYGVEQQLLQQPTGAVSQVAPPTMDQIITQALVDGDFDKAMAFQDFQNRPTAMEAFQAAVAFARSPADQQLISSIARGETPVAPPPAGTVQRIGPAPDFLVQEYNTFQQRLRAGRPPSPAEQQRFTQRFQEGRSPLTDALDQQLAEQQTATQQAEARATQQQAKFDLELTRMDTSNQKTINTMADRLQSLKDEFTTYKAGESERFDSGVNGGRNGGAGGNGGRNGRNGGPADVVGGDQIKVTGLGFTGGLNLGTGVYTLSEAFANILDSPNAMVGPDGKRTPEEIWNILISQNPKAPVGNLGDIESLRNRGKPEGPSSKITDAADAAAAAAAALEDQADWASYGYRSEKLSPQGVNLPVGGAYTSGKSLNFSPSPEMLGYQTSTGQFAQQAREQEALNQQPLFSPASEQEWYGDDPDFYAGGGLTQGNNLEIVGEEGPELVDLPPGTFVLPLKGLSQSEVRRAKAKGTKGYQNGGIVFQELPLGLRQLQAGRAITPPRGYLSRAAGLTLPSAQAFQNITPESREIFMDLASQAGIPPKSFEQELRTTMPSGQRQPTARILPLNRRGIR